MAGEWSNVQCWELGRIFLSISFEEGLLLARRLKFEIDLLLIKLQDNSYTSLQLQLHV